jgi:hypothetical protein
MPTKAQKHTERYYHAIHAARARVIEKRLQYQKDKGIYRLSCGRWINAAGKTKEKVFTLGRDEMYARCLALSLRQTWAGIVAMAEVDEDENPLWSDEDIAAAISEADDIYRQRVGKPNLSTEELPPAPEWAPSIPDPDADRPVAKTSKLITLRDAVDAYAEALKATKLSDSNRTRQGESLVNLLKHVDPATRLDALTYDRLVEITSVYRNRPLTERGTKIGVLTAKTVMQHVRQLLSWLEDAGHWVGPRRWERAIKYKVSEEMTPQERRAKKQAVQTFTAEEIGKLWRACETPVERSIILFGLNFAATQRQIAALTKDDHQGDHLHLYRSKTAVEVYYDYWPETHKLMQHWLATTPPNPDNLLIITSNGKPLLHFSPNGGKTDSVDDAWKRILKRTDLAADRKLTFSALRDTTSNALRDRGGPLVQQHVLAQAPTTVAEKHYTDQVVRSDFKLMNEHMMAWYAQELKPSLAAPSGAKLPP